MSARHGLPPDFLADLLSRTPLAPLVANKVTLTAKGRGPCPLHGGRAGSTSFSVRRGRYRCFSCGETGDAIDWTMWEARAGFLAAVRDLAGRAGMKMPGDIGTDNPAEVARLAAERAARLAAYQREREAKEAAERAAAIADGTGIWRQCVPIDGTLGERYLTEQRSLTRPASGWAPCLGWHAAERMLVGAGTDADGAVQFVHRVFLTTDGTNARRPDGAKRKTTRGPMDDAAIRLPGTGDTLHAEGLETGLSAWIATGAPTLIYAGQIADRMQPQPGRNVVLRDDDAPGSPADRLLIAAIERWHDAGIDYAIATPWPERRGDKSDFNDLLREAGPEAVAARIAEAEAWRSSTSGDSGAAVQVQQRASAEAAGEAPPEPPPGWEEARPARWPALSRWPTPIPVPWVPEAPGAEPLAGVQTAIVSLASRFFADAHAADMAARSRRERAESAEAAEKARARAVKAERLMYRRIDQRNVIAEDIQNRLATGEPTRALRVAAVRAEAKMRRAIAAADLYRDRWIIADARLTALPDTPPLAMPYVINSAETATKKTGITLRMAAAWIETRKAAGLPHRMIVMVPALRPDVVVEPDTATMAAFYADKPTDRQRKRVLKYLGHKEQEKAGNAPRKVERLGQQMLKRAREIGIHAAVFLGRGDTNCRNLDAVYLSQFAGADPSAGACKKGDEACFAMSWCLADGYMRNIIEAAAADLVIVAHNFITERLPATVREGAWAVIIDEEFATQLDFHTELTLESLGREAIETAPAKKDNGTIDIAATAMLVEQFGSVAAAYNAAGYLSVDALKAAGFRLAMLRDPALQLAEFKELRDANASCKIPPDMHPAMTPEQRKAEADRCAPNEVTRHRDALLRALYEMVTKGEAGAGLVSCVTKVTPSGQHSRLVIRGQRDVAEWLRPLPLLNLNATPSLDLARLTFPDMTMPEIPKAARPHAETHQILGRSGRRYLEKHPKRVEEIRAFVRLKMIGRQRGLIVVYKDIEHLFQGIPGVATMHHGDLAGDDTHRDCDFLLVIGGSFANYEDAASIAAGRGAGAVPIVAPVPVTRIATLADGTAVAVPDVMAYADPGVDAVHDSIFRSSVIQAAGRVGQFERTAENPCAIYIMANVVMDRPVQSIRFWSSVRPGPGQRETVTGQVACGRRGMRTLHPNIYSSERSADSHRYREDGDIARKRARVLAIIASDTVPWFSAMAQAAGQGHKPEEFFFREGRGEALKAALEADWGPLVMWEVTQVTQGTDVLRTQLHQALTRPVRSTSPEEEEAAPVWQAEAATAEAEPVHGPPDG
jgi:hypothetical protein